MQWISRTFSSCKTNYTHWTTPHFFPCSLQNLCFTKPCRSFRCRLVFEKLIPGHGSCEEWQRKAAGIWVAWHSAKAPAGDVLLAPSDSPRPILSAWYGHGIAFDPGGIQTQANGQQGFSKPCVVTSWMRILYFSTLDQVLEISPDGPKTESESYKLWLEESDCIFISGCTRQSFNSNFEFHLSILIIYASPLEIPIWSSPMEILGGCANKGNNRWRCKPQNSFDLQVIRSKRHLLFFIGKKGLHHE